jgi:hypothetical protein
VASGETKDDSHQNRHSEVLTLEVHPPEEYLHGAHLKLVFTLRNVSGKEVLVAQTFQLGRYIDLDITDSHGKAAQWCGRIVAQADSVQSFTMLPPGRSLRKTVLVSCFNADDPSRAAGYRIDGPGQYTIKATYHLPQPTMFFEKFFPTATVVRGPISAKPIIIQVKADK